MDLNKKGISPVVSTALLIVVAVVAVVGFSSWFGSYQSVVNSDLETKTSSSSIGGTEIIGIYNNILYFRNSYPDIIGFTNIKITGTDCVYSGSAQPNSIAQIPFDNCSSNLKGIYEIVAESNDKIYSKKIYLKGVEVLSGVLADSPVQGVEYNTTSGLNGITDANGVFKYNSGDSVTFILGNLTLKNIPAKNYITPLDIFNTTDVEDPNVVNLVRLFMALDTDNNPSTGISVNTELVDLLDSNIDFDQSSSDFDSIIPAEIDTASIDETEAIEHINETLTLISGEIEEEEVQEDSGPASCSLDGITIESGSNYTFYNASHGLILADSEVRTCNDGILDGNESYIYSSFIYDCSLDGITIESGSNYTFYSSSLLPNGELCEDYSEIRTCNDGVLDGNESYINIGCEIITSLSCLTDNDGDGLYDISCAYYPMINTTFEGILDVNDENTTQVVENYCYLMDDKSSCGSNFIIDGCGSGTVLDLETNLCWLRDMYSSGDTKTWEDAKTYCSGLTTAGKTWSLPSKEELFTLVDEGRSGSPYIVGGADNIFTNVQTGDYYWTISTYGPYTSFAWDVSFNYGYGNLNDKTDTRYVTCVARE